ncbi:MAG TPA: Uma2 family endonuclease [Gemmataceae bacterium]|nr:Uma2 family endonuclease [Gemmataceae bacterium]
MSVAELPRAPDSSVRTFADLLDDLGQVPPERILLTPAPGTATEADLLRLSGLSNRRICELVDGTLVEKGIGLRESLLAVFLGSLLHEFVRKSNLGIVTGEQGTLRLWQGLVRIPDVAFIAWDRIPGRRIPDEPIPELAPDLAVEVLSVSNTSAEMDRKRVEYFRAGTRIVWEIDPRVRTVAVYTNPDDPIVLRDTSVLDGAPVLPGFTLSLTDLFGELDQHG